MIRVEEVREIPRAVVEQLAPYSAREYSMVKEFVPAIERASGKILVTYDGDIPLTVMGIKGNSLLGTPDFWFLLCTGFQRKHLRKVKQFIRELVRTHWGLRTQVEDVFLVGRKFVEFAGFKRTDISIHLLGRTFHTYEARI